jgi:hypothetical protein
VEEEEQEYQDESRKRVARRSQGSPQKASRKNAMWRRKMSQGRC